MQNDNYSNPSGIDKSNYEAEKTNKKTFIYSMILVLVIVVVVLAIALSGRDSHYENGNAYLKEKKYTEALSEYQKVDADDKDFRMAQSKINYINGLNAYNANMYPAAMTYLSKVNSDDEYYHDSQLMMQKMNEVTEQDRLKSQIDSLKNKKDTLVVKHEVAKETANTVSDVQLNKRYYSKLNGIINSFESQYQSAAVAQVTSKKDYLVKMEAIRRDLINSQNEAAEKDPELAQLRNDINTWVDKRNAYISRLISENSVSETNTSRSLKEEGDKLYFKVTSQLSRVKARYS